MILKIIRRFRQCFFWDIDSTNFTFRGRFSSKEQALLVDSASSQKINSTLRWLVNNQTESRGVRTIVYQPKKKNVKNDLSYYTYLKDVRYQVLAHFEWNDLREELADDRDENKHHNIAMRSVRQGGRRDIFLGARECQAYVEPCEFGGGEGFYDSYGEWNMGYMFHGFSYPDENPDHNLISRFWMPIMKDGVIRFESPDSPLLDRHIVRHGLNVKEFNLGKNVTSVEEE